MLHNKDNTIAICGAGIAGVATAYYLSKYSNAKIVLIDKHQPLSFTTSKSGENFRDFWPQPCMRALSSESIRLMKELKHEYGEDAFRMSFSGYNFISHNEAVPIFSTQVDEATGKFFEEISDADIISQKYPYLNEKVKRIVSIKNAGAIDVYGMGSLMLKAAKMKGMQEAKGEITNIIKTTSKYDVVLDATKKISVDKIVIAAGPFMNYIANMLGLTFPIENILQQKFIIPDPNKIIPRDMPFTIYADEQYLDWSEEEAAFFKQDESYKWLLDKFPGGLHIKPEGQGIKLGWAFNRVDETPKWKITLSDYFPQIVLKGASRFMSRLIEYEKNIPTPVIQYAGYYTRTKENWPLIGPTKDSNVFVIGALSGFGTMTACAAGQLCVQYILNKNELPDYAPYFHPNRYQNSAILREIRKNKNDGQL